MLSCRPNRPTGEFTTGAGTCLEDTSLSSARFAFYTSYRSTLNLTCRQAKKLPVAIRIGRRETANFRISAFSLLFSGIIFGAKLLTKQEKMKNSLKKEIPLLWGAQAQTDFCCFRQRLNE
jgi:hypothetical protein